MPISQQWSHAKQADSLVLVTGATGFIGAHIIDSLLSRGLKVRAAVRSLQKGELMKKARPQYASQLELVQIGDISTIGAFDKIMDGVDAVVHSAAVRRTFHVLPGMRLTI
jgi:nucleoside-diphosphate-sugar epimerase